MEHPRTTFLILRSWWIERRLLVLLLRVLALVLLLLMRRVPELLSFHTLLLVKLFLFDAQILVVGAGAEHEIWWAHVYEFDVLGGLAVCEDVVLDEVLHVLLAVVDGVELVTNLHTHFPTQISHMDSHRVLRYQLNKRPDRHLDPLKLVHILRLLLWWLLLRRVALTLIILLLPGQVHVDILRQKVLLLTIKLLPLLHHPTINDW